MDEWEPWLAFDLDGTLVKYTSGDSGHCQIGESIKPMCDLVRDYLLKGWRIKIFTARAGPHGDSPAAEERRARTIKMIEEWTVKEFGKQLEVTCCKDYAMVALFDDLAVQIEANTGRILGKLPQL